MIPYARQDITQADIDAVEAVLRSDFLTQGPAVPSFEQAVRRRTGAQRAIAVNSATSALHIACLALDLGPGDLLWTVPNTFVASANCGRYCGAAVDFVDIDPASWNISIESLRAKLAAARSARRLPKIVVTVAFAGQPPQQDAVAELSREYGFRIIEDASHAVGASRSGEPVGSCRWSDVTILSFHPVKIITTGEGGMALTNDETVGDRMALLRTHGVTRDPRIFLDPDARIDPPAWYYEQQVLGFNYRMTDIQGALGASQLARLEDYVQRRNALAHRYDEALRGLPLQLPTVLPENRSSFHLYVVRLRSDARKSRRAVFDELRAAGIGVNVHYTPVHLQPYYRQLGFHEGQYPQAEAYGREAITLPLYPAMSAAMQEQVVVSLRRTLSA
jgi:UDP-4-amino-4,6-dideoxy-N-acetyl-beta-L-altrosamine transaminase